jgi:DNA-binding transcriptional regulator YiaG
MISKSSQPGGVSPHGNAEVVSLPARGADRHIAAQVAAARSHLDMTPGEFASCLAEATGKTIRPEHVDNWETGRSIPPGNVLWTCMRITGSAPAGSATLLDSVPNGFPADALAGPWVTVYQFTHAGRPHYHADIAHVTALDDNRVHAVNHPPEPRTQGRRRSPFHNEIEATLFGRHLIGTWRNSSDTRYYGSLHLSVMPGEVAMDGYYTGVASDIEVSSGNWRWVRLDGDPSDLTLREPHAIYELVMNRMEDDTPLTAADIREEA